MSCFHSLKAIKTPYLVTAKDGHQYNKIIFRAELEPDFLPIQDVETGELFEMFEVPCGKCAGCRMDASRRWADRCAEEAITCLPESCWFLTLTYDEHFITSEMEVFENLNGDWYDNKLLTLYPKDLVDFMKRVRRYWEYNYSFQGVRMFACGEYGTQGLRPHFHVLLFNCQIKDLRQERVHYVNNIPIPVYKSGIMSDLWGKGYCWIEKFDWANAAYVARYVQKKSGLPTKEFNERYIEAGLEPEFIRMSRMPAIGTEFYEKNRSEWFKPTNKIFLPTHGGQKSKLVYPARVFTEKYSEMLDQEYDQIIQEENPEKRYVEWRERFYDMMKQQYNRTLEAKLIEQALLSKTDLDPIEHRHITERQILNSYKTLKRHEWE